MEEDNCMEEGDYDEPIESDEQGEPEEEQEKITLQEREEAFATLVGNCKNSAPTRAPCETWRFLPSTSYSNRLRLRPRPLCANRRALLIQL